MKTKIKQNKNTPAVRVASAALAVFVLLFSLCVPSFAYTDNWDGNFTPLPVLSSSPSAPFSDATLIFNTGGYMDQRACSYSSADVYSFAVGTSGGSINIYFVSKTANSSIGNFSYHLNSHQSTNNTFTISDNTGDWYYFKSWGFYDSSSYRLYVPMYPTLQDGLDAIDATLEPPPPLTGEFSYSLPAGNVIFVDVTNLNVAVDLSQNTPISYWGLGATQFSGTVSSIPSSFDLPISGTSIISWTGSGKADSFGKYSSWVSHATVSGITSDHNHLYYVVANPLQNNSTAGAGYDVSSVANGDITIHVSNSNSVKVYQLETSFNAGVYDSNSAGDTFTGSNNGSGGLSFTNDTTGNPDMPSFGGMTSPESSASTIHDFLQNIATQISGFFSGAIGAVSTLVSAGRDFMQSVSGLYMWLPAPVYTVLTSAIILVITIGVIKVFV